MPLYPVAWAAGLLPLLTIHLCYVLAATYGQVPWCIPYVDSCTSISATGREPPAYFVFKGLMIPAAMVMMAYWMLAAAWLRELGCRRRIWRGVLLVLGLLAGVALIFYALVLGWIGPGYRQQRETGVTAFFGFTFLAQLLLLWLLEQRPRIALAFPRLVRTLEWLAGLMLALGLASVFVAYAVPQVYRRLDNAMAWNFTVLLCVNVLVCAELWRRSGWQASFSLHAGTR
jgi:hypothetical protein